MRVCPVPAAAVFCPAMLLLLTLLTIIPTTTAVATNTTTPCAPASCGGLTIAYPFWLDGTHARECGYKAFQVTCDQGNVSLKNSFWAYEILDIFYENSSFRVTNVALSDGTCDTEMAFNASSDLAPTPFEISPQNQELFFLYDCRRQARQLPRAWAPVNCSSNANNSFAWLAGKYKPDASLAPLPGNCTVSMMPVLGYDGATGADYQRLMKGGFLLQYTVEDCEACTATGGRCRIDDSTDVFECHCSNGDYPVTCGELIYA